MVLQVRKSIKKNLQYKTKKQFESFAKKYIFLVYI